MNSRLAPRTTREPRPSRVPIARSECPRDQRGDQRQQRGEVGRQVDVAVGEHRASEAAHTARSARPRPFSSQPHAPRPRGARRRGARDRRGGVGAGVVGDRDPEAVRELRGQVGVQAPDRRLEVGSPRCRRGRRRRARRGRSGGGAGSCAGCRSGSRDVDAHGRRRCRPRAVRPLWSTCAPAVRSDPGRLHAVIDGCSGEVVDGGAADGRGGEVLPAPTRRSGRRRRCRRCPSTPPRPPMASAADEPVDLLRRDEVLELRERRGRVGAVEPADGHHRLPGRELVARGGVGADGGRDPGVGAGVLLQQRGELGAGRRASRAGRRQPPRPPPRPCRAVVAVAGAAPRSGRAVARGAAAPPGPRPSPGSAAAAHRRPGRPPAPRPPRPGRRDRAGVRGRRRGQRVRGRPAQRRPPAATARRPTTAARGSAVHAQQRHHPGDPPSRARPRPATAARSACVAAARTPSRRQRERPPASSRAAGRGPVPPQRTAPRARRARRSPAPAPPCSTGG